MNAYRITCSEEDAPKLLSWIKDRGGVEAWSSRDLSEGGQLFYAPACVDGAKAPPPGWRFSEPEFTVTDASEIEVVRYKEAGRFYAAIRSGAAGMRVTDGAQRKIDKALEKVGPGSILRFDYGTQEAVIMIPDGSQPLSEWTPPVKPD